MDSEAISGIGTKFRRWNVGTEVWDEIAEITHIGGPDKSRETIDVTHLGSTDGYREFISGLRDGGTVTLQMHFTRKGYDLMNEDFESDDKQNYEILLPDEDETSYEFRGLVTELPLDIPIDAEISVDVSIKVSGKVVTNSGSAGDVV